MIDMSTEHCTLAMEEASTAEHHEVSRDANVNNANANVNNANAHANVHHVNHVNLDADADANASEPPSYDALLDAPALLRKHKYNIQPREDEGREVLPPYSTAISLENVFLKKMELEDAVHKASDRNWHKVLVTLQGTALQFHKYKSSALFKPDSPAMSKKGRFLQSYNLQYADVGIAADYVKKRFVIRVRAETDQFLLSCNKIETFVLWLQSLFAAIDLALPLDEREIPRDLSIPRRSRRRPRAGRSGAQSDAGAEREQPEIVASHFPPLADAGDDAAASAAQADIESSSSSSAEETESSSAPRSRSPARPARSVASLALPTSSSSSTSSPSANSNPPSPSSAATTPAEMRSQMLVRARLAMLTSAPPDLATPIANPSITSDGKWQPEHHWTHFYDMLYAKRCMAILTHRSPRKSNVVIMMNKQWVVDWATGKLEPCQPPDYAELLEEEVTVDLAIAEYGTVY